MPCTDMQIEQQGIIKRTCCFHASNLLGKDRKIEGKQFLFQEWRNAFWAGDENF